MYLFSLFCLLVVSISPHSFNFFDFQEAVHLIDVLTTKRGMTKVMRWLHAFHTIQVACWKKLLLISRILILSWILESNFRLPKTGTVAFSTMLASPALENCKLILLYIDVCPYSTNIFYHSEKNVPVSVFLICLKSLVFVIQHQTELDGLTSFAAERRLQMLAQAFRLSLSILNSRREPSLTFKHSPAEVNRLCTVLTVISVEFPIPNDISHEINGIAANSKEMFT